MALLRWQTGLLSACLKDAVELHPANLPALLRQAQVIGAVRLAFFEPGTQRQNLIEQRLPFVPVQRAGEIIRKIRSFITKRPDLHKSTVNLNEVIEEVG